MDVLKGRTAIEIFQKFPNLKKKPCPRYPIDTVDLDKEMIRKYEQYQVQKKL